MKIVNIDPFQPEPEIVQQAAELIRQGEIICHPTETVYGLAGDYLNEEALHAVFRLKQRKPVQPFSILVDSVERMLEISGVALTWVQQFLEEIFPDAITILLPRQRKLPIAYWNQFDYLGFRYPNHPLSVELVRVAGTPVITTSANLSGQRAPERVMDIPESILDGVALVLDGGETIYKTPSTIIQLDVEKRELRSLRAGAIPWKIIQNQFDYILSRIKL